MKCAYDGWVSSRGSRSSSRSTSRSRKVWNGEYHSRSQCVCGTIETVRRSTRSAGTLSSFIALACLRRQLVLSLDRLGGDVAGGTGFPVPPRTSVGEGGGERAGLRGGGVVRQR